MINWDNPKSRLDLIERVGAAEYNRLAEEHRRGSIAATVNGWTIRPTISRFGKLFLVEGTDKGFRTLAEAAVYAESLVPFTRKIDT